MSAHTELIPERANRLLIAGLVAVNLLQFLIVPIFLAPLDPLWGLLLILPVLVSTPYWSVIHEAIHGHLLRDKRSNDFWGRVLCVLFGSPFQLLRLGHLMHHRFNRTPIQRSDVSDEQERPGLAEKLWYYHLILGGLWFWEFVASAMALLPDQFYKPLVRIAFGEHAPDGRTMWRAAKTQLLAEPGRSRMRFDGLLICLLFAGSFWLYGAFWWMLALALAGRAFLVSFFDNAYHYGNLLEDVKAGYNLRLPRWAERFALYFNMHEVHHRDPNLPWSALPARFEKDGDRYHLGYVYAGVRQLWGPIPEPEAAEGKLDSRLLTRDPEQDPTRGIVEQTGMGAT
ncbi:MAG: fatty acid desaturase [Pseudomonadota bacterium]